MGQPAVQIHVSLSGYKNHEPPSMFREPPSMFREFPNK
jgi:hypothetical protein